MQSPQRMFVLAVAALAMGCGTLPEGTAGVPAGIVENALAEQALRTSDSTAAFNISSEEVSAVELAKFAQHRVKSGPFLTYVKAQQARHEALIDTLRAGANASDLPVSNAMSQSGTQQWTALLQKSDAAFEKIYLRLQAPWQRQVINKLAQLQQTAQANFLRDYADTARAAWEQDFQEGADLDPR